MNSKKYKIAIGLVLIFSLGILIGALGNRIYTRHRIADAMQGPPGARLIPIFIRKISNELSLTPSQRETVDRIAEQLRTELAHFRETYQPELEAIVDARMQEIRAALTPEQQKQMDAIHERIKHRRFRSERHGRKGRPGRLERHSDRLAEALGLSKEQTETAIPILRDYFREHRRLTRRFRRDETLGEEVLQEALQRLGRETESKLQGVLTPEQATRFKEFLMESPGIEREPQNTEGRP